MISKSDRRNKIKARIRGRISGTPERPRLCVFRSNKQIYAQVIDDVAGNTLCSASSKGITEGNKSEIAAKVGEAVAKKALEAGINTVVFDRNGFLFHGRVKSLADGARKGGLKFTFTFAAIVVVGDGNGVIGYGLGKANEVTTAISKGTEVAKKNLIKVPIHKGTIPHEVVAKFGGSRIIMKPASAGTGVKAGGAMRAVFETVGVTDVICKSKGSSNPHNLVKATLKALDEMRCPATVAHYRGITVDKVFNG